MHEALLSRQTLASHLRHVQCRQTAATDVPEFDWDLGEEGKSEQPAGISVGA